MKCLNCNKEIVPREGQRLADVKRKKFCNSSCAATYNNKAFPKKQAAEYNCLNCGSKLNRKGKYCNNNCQMEYQYKTYIDDWKNGLETGLSGEYQISSHIKKYLYNKYNNKCCKCGWSKTNPYTGNIPLEIEHIDGNYQNNHEGNLELLCPNCHSLTKTYKGANRGHGRASRNKYY